jgi:hypothetical protein
LLRSLQWAARSFSTSLMTHPPRRVTASGPRHAHHQPAPRPSVQRRPSRTDSDPPKPRRSGGRQPSHTPPRQPALKRRSPLSTRRGTARTRAWATRSRASSVQHLSANTGSQRATRGEPALPVRSHQFSDLCECGSGRVARGSNRRPSAFSRLVKRSLVRHGSLAIIGSSCCAC